METSWGREYSRGGNSYKSYQERLRLCKEKLKSLKNEYDKLSNVSVYAEAQQDPVVSIPLSDTEQYQYDIVSNYVNKYLQSKNLHLNDEQMDEFELILIGKIFEAFENRKINVFNTEPSILERIVKNTINQFMKRVKEENV